MIPSHLPFARFSRVIRISPALCPHLLAFFSEFFLILHTFSVMFPEFFPHFACISLVFRPQQVAPAPPQHFSSSFRAQVSAFRIFSPAFRPRFASDLLAAVGSAQFLSISLRLLQVCPHLSEFLQSISLAFLRICWYFFIRNFGPFPRTPPRISISFSFEFLAIFPHSSR